MPESSRAWATRQLFKRTASKLSRACLTGTYIAVESDGNKISDVERFAKAMSQVGPFRRLTYSELTGKNESPRHQSTRTGQTAENVPF